MSESLFSTRAASPGKRSRFTLAPGAVRTPEGGLAGLGVDGNGVPYLVHQLPRTVEAVTAQSAALALASGAIPASDLVGAFVEMGTLDALAEAVAAARKPALAPVAEPATKPEPKPEPKVAASK